MRDLYRHSIVMSCLRAMAPVLLLIGISGAGCIPDDWLWWKINPFQDLDPVPMDGEPHGLKTSIAPLGLLTEGDVINLEVTGEGVESVSVLIAEEEESPEAGVIVGGGPAGTAFDYRIAMTGHYFVFVRFDASVRASQQRASLTVGPGNPAYRPPASQPVVVVFEEGYLTEPGLVDPDSFTDEEYQLMTDLSGLVRDEIMVTLRSIFDGMPVEIIDDRGARPEGPYSVLRFSPRRELAVDVTAHDVALPYVDPDSPCAAELVIFGEVLPRGVNVDPGNRVPDDEAVVYVGSFQGRGIECRSAVIDSVSHIVMALSHTAAHEIGHLVGLYHVALVDIMDRRVTLAFQRQLEFGRRQTLIEVPVMNRDGSIEIYTRVQTNIIQDPELYFRATFDTSTDGR